MSVVAEITDEYGIPWSKAQELVQQAKENLEVTGMKDGRKKKEIKKEKKAIKEEAVRLFEAIPEEEKEELMNKAEIIKPEDSTHKKKKKRKLIPCTIL